MEKYYSELRAFGKIIYPRPILMPWPMTQREQWAVVGSGTVICVAGAIFAVWLAVEFVEPPWRLLPLVIWFLLLRFVVGPLLLKGLKPAGASERVAESG